MQGGGEGWAYFPIYTDPCLQDRFIAQLEQKVDLNQACFEPSIIANRWLSVRLEMLGNLIILFAALFAVLGRDTLEPGLVGLSLSYAMQITQNLNMLIRQTSMIENNMVSVERIQEYQTGLPREAPWALPGDPTSLEDNETEGVQWPEKGEVVFQGLETRSAKL
jgi:ATP-binding cassette subfamily C (CFTR/MRP) protein 1